MTLSSFHKLKAHQEFLSSLLPQFSEKHLCIDGQARKNTSTFLLSLAEVIEELRETDEGRKIGGALEILTTQRHTILFELQVYQKTLFSSSPTPRKELEMRDWLYSQLGTLSRRMQQAIDELDLIWPTNQS
jgi:hypothetical protein